MALYEATILTVHVKGLINATANIGKQSFPSFDKRSRFQKSLEAK